MCKYNLAQCIYSGRTADVYQISDNKVLKLYHGNQSRATFSHPHLMPVFDAGELNHRYFEVYPRFSTHLEQHPVHPDVFFDAITPALHAMHNGGWLHCDIQPKNIWVLPHLCLGDFGSLRPLQHQVRYPKNPFSAPETQLSFLSAGTDWYSMARIYLWLDSNGTGKHFTNMQQVLNTPHEQRKLFFTKNTV